ncbi:hypothetical protein GCM10011572_52920 [Pseudoduganella buxea]|uniref:Uncharacterized protein n=1 Tax=Pseudoduganella buxea TaxID=1949069 RepID=A0ABQ1LK30_9BURK|nr:hypothetical protein GCM10011572_52920 [Pseudoduganella buxea]
MRRLNKLRVLRPADSTKNEIDKREQEINRLFIEFSGCQGAVYYPGRRRYKEDYFYSRQCTSAKL